MALKKKLFQKFRKLENKKHCNWLDKEIEYGVQHCVLCVGNKDNIIKDMKHLKSLVIWVQRKINWIPYVLIHDFKQKTVLDRRTIVRKKKENVGEEEG